MMGREISILERLAVDGKTLRGSGRVDGKALQLLSAVTRRLRLSVAQLASAEKSNEIPAYRPLRETIPRLEGSMITADAMQCQQEAARYTTQERGADYLFGLKGNQEGILERATVKLPQESFPPEYDTGWSKAHGRLERGRLQRKAVSPEAAGLCGCWQFIAVRRQRQYLKRGRVLKAEEEYAYAVTEPQVQPAPLAVATRAPSGSWTPTIRRRRPLVRPARRLFSDQFLKNAPSSVSPQRHHSDEIALLPGFVGELELGRRKDLASQGDPFVLAADFETPVVISTLMAMQVLNVGRAPYSRSALAGHVGA